MAASAAHRAASISPACGPAYQGRVATMATLAPVDHTSARPVRRRGGHDRGRPAGRRPGEECTVTDPDHPTADREPSPELATLRAQLLDLRDEVHVLAQMVSDTMHPTAEDYAAEEARAAEESRAAEQARAAEKAPAFELRHPTLEDWVTEFFAPTFCRSISPGVRWCAQWWDHAEAISRLEALWRSWEVLRHSAFSRLIASAWSHH